MADMLNNGVHGHTEAEKYIPPSSTKVKKHVEWFSGLKLGLMMHWSPATQLGLLESWPLCDGDGDWSQVEIDWTQDMDILRRQYWALNRTFNPIRFNPKKLAKTASDCGFKYILFTTKHHDGFCMFDTATTNYKVTAPECPFSQNLNANITKALFSACREEGLGISAYFSKPDWHSDYYWHRGFGVGKTRNVNYDIQKHPELWEKFVRYTHAQLNELTSNYGKIDVLWLDGGWVRADNLAQDIRLNKAVDQIRASTQPHLIVCDRTCGGLYENIVTPEQTIPTAPLGVPWEACVTLGKYFSFHYDDEYKPAEEVIRLLLCIVSNGGSLALNVTPRPDGAIPPQALAILARLGRWLEIHGEGIYGSISANLPDHENVYYTKKKDLLFAFFRYNTSPSLPLRLFLRRPGNIHSVRLLRTGQELPFSVNGDWIIADTAGVSMRDAEYADCFVLTY